MNYETHPLLIAKKQSADEQANLLQTALDRITFNDQSLNQLEFALGLRTFVLGLIENLDSKELSKTIDVKQPIFPQPDNYFERLFSIFAYHTLDNDSLKLEETFTPLIDKLNQKVCENALLHLNTKVNQKEKIQKILKPLIQLLEKTPS